MAEASPIDEATCGQQSYLDLSDEEKRQFACDVSDDSVRKELAPLESHLASLERAATEAARNALTARSKLDAKGVQIGRRMRLCLRYRLSCMVLLYEARQGAPSNRWDVILGGRDVLVAMAREMGFVKTESLAPTRTGDRWLMTIRAMYGAGDAGKSLLSFILREGALVPSGGLQTAIESVCIRLSALDCDVDLLPKFLRLLDVLNRGAKPVSTKTFSCNWRDLSSPTVAQDAAVVSAAVADDTLEEGAGAAAARAAVWAEAAGGSGEGVEMDAEADARAGEAMADVGVSTPAGVLVGASTWVEETEAEEAPQDGLTEAEASTETGAESGAAAEDAMVCAQLLGAGDETTLPAAGEPDSADGAAMTAFDAQPEPSGALSEAAAAAAACAEAPESCDLSGTLSAADALRAAEAALDELFDRYNPCDAPALFQALQSALSKRRDDGALLLSGTTGVGELHAAPVSAPPSASQLLALGVLTTAPVRTALRDVSNGNAAIPRSNSKRPRRAEVP